MILYLTTVVGIAPGVAGTIFSTALTIGAFTTVIVGYKSDNSTNPKGKRRPYMIAFLIPLCLSMLLFFTKWDISGNIQIAYYAIIAIIAIMIYFCFNGFLIPYESLGAELTEDYTERANLRTINSIVIWISIFLTGSVAMSIVDFMGSKGYSDATSWLASGILVAATLFLGGLVSILATKGKEHLTIKKNTTTKDGSIKNIFKTYLHVLKVKQTRSLVIWDFVFFVGETLMVSGQSYLIIYVLGLGNSGMAILLGINVVFALIGTASANLLSAKTNKKTALVIALALMVIGSVLVKVLLTTGISRFAIGVLFELFFSLPYGMILMLCFAMIYDSAEINEYKFGDNMIAATVGIFVFVMTIAVAVGNWLVGFILQIAGFNGAVEVQPDTVANMISNSVTIIPAAFILVSILLLVGYKINKKNHGAIIAALEAKNNGKEYSEDDFKEIL